MNYIFKLYRVRIYVDKNCSKDLFMEKHKTCRENKLRKIEQNTLNKYLA